MTLGEYRVGIDFNPSGNDLVHRIKRAAADLIDLCDEERKSMDKITDRQPFGFTGETIRLWSEAMTLIEDAAMWAVKAATKKPQ